MASGTQYYVYNQSPKTVQFDGYVLFPYQAKYVRFYTPNIDDLVIANLVVVTTVTRGSTTVTGDEVKVVGGPG